MPLNPTTPNHHKVWERATAVVRRCASNPAGMVHYKSLRHNHDSKTLRQTRSLYDPSNSKMHRSFERIGRVIQSQVDIFHVETVLDERLFPFYLSWILKLIKHMNFIEWASGSSAGGGRFVSLPPEAGAAWTCLRLCRSGPSRSLPGDRIPTLPGPSFSELQLLMKITTLSLKLLPQWLRKWIFWSPLTWGPYGLLQVHAGETVQVHQRTLAANFRDKVVDVEGQADILILGPSCIGPYTKDMYFNPLLVNTYTLGYWYNMYIGGTPLVSPGPGRPLPAWEGPWQLDTPTAFCSCSEPRYFPSPSAQGGRRCHLRQPNALQVEFTQPRRVQVSRPQDRCLPTSRTVRLPTPVLGASLPYLWPYLWRTTTARRPNWQPPFIGWAT